MDLPLSNSSVKCGCQTTAGRLAIVCLWAIILGGGWLRAAQLDEPLWVDELHTSWVVADGIQDIHPRAEAGNQSPLYFYVVWGCIQLFGHAEWSLRLPSLVAGIVLIFFAFESGRRWSGSLAAGLLVAFLVAVNHECILFANEARPYAWIQLFALMHGWVFLRVLERPSVALRTLLILGGAWLFYLHYTAALFLLAEAGCYVLLRFTCPDRLKYRTQHCLLDCAVTFVLLLPAWPHLAQIAERRDNWNSFVRLSFSPGLRNAFYLYIVGPFAGLILVRLLLHRWRSSTTTRWQWTWVACWLVIPPSIAFTATLTNVAALWMLRYFVASLVAAMVLAGLVTSKYPTAFMRYLAALALMVTAIHFSGIVTQWRYDGRIVGDRNEDWPAAVAWILEELPDAGDSVVLCPGLIEDLELAESDDPNLVDYCLFPLNGIYRLPKKELIPLPTTRRLEVPADLARRLPQSSAMGVIVRARPRTVAIIREKLLAAFKGGRSGKVRVEQRRWGFLTTLILRRRP